MSNYLNRLITLTRVNGPNKLADKKLFNFNQVSVENSDLHLRWEIDETISEFAEGVVCSFVNNINNDSNRNRPNFGLIKLKFPGTIITFIRSLFANIYKNNF